MRRTSFNVLALALFLTFTVQAQQAQPPELQRLNYFVGEWTFDDGGNWVCKWLGSSFVQCDGGWTNAAGNAVVALMTMGYDAEKEAYFGHRYYGGGYSDSGIGWVDGNTWTWLYLDQVETKLRFTGIEESQNLWTYRWERSVKGGPWEASSDGAMTKVR